MKRIIPFLVALLLARIAVAAQSDYAVGYIHIVNTSTQGVSFKIQFFCHYEYAPGNSGIDSSQGDQEYLAGCSDGYYQLQSLSYPSSFDANSWSEVVLNDTVKLSPYPGKATGQVFFGSVGNGSASSNYVNQTTKTVYVQNDGTTPQMAWVAGNAGAAGNPQGPSTVTAMVQPGGRAIFTVPVRNDPCQPLTTNSVVGGIGEQGSEFAIGYGNTPTSVSAPLFTNLTQISNNAYSLTFSNPIMQNVQSPSSYLATNGYIDFSQAGGTNMAMIDAAGFNKLDQDLVAINATLNNSNTFRLAYASGTNNGTGGTNGGSGGTTNVFSITNQVSVSLSNVLTEAQLTNDYRPNGALGQSGFMEMSNRLASANAAIIAATNQAGALSGASVISAAGTAFGSGTLPADSEGGGVSENVTLAPGVVMTVDTANLPAAFTVLHRVFAWAIYVTVFVSCWKIFSNNVKEALKVPQATTSGESILGTNINIASSLVMAGLIIAAIATLTAVAMPKLLGYLAFIVGNPFDGLDAFGYGFVDSLVPIPLLLSSIGVITTFRLVMDSGGMVCGGIIKLLVGA